MKRIIGPATGTAAATGATDSSFQPVDSFDL
jgi:hypothetical protein